METLATNSVNSSNSAAFPQSELGDTLLELKGLLLPLRDLDRDFDLDLDLDFDLDFDLDLGVGQIVNFNEIVFSESALGI